MENQNKNIIVKALAWIGIIVIAAFIIALLYALFTKNGKLAFAMTFALIFISILFWAGIGTYKWIAKASTKNKDEEMKSDFMNIANTKTKKK